MSAFDFRPYPSSIVYHFDCKDYYTDLHFHQPQTITALHLEAIGSLPPNSTILLLPIYHFPSPQLIAVGIFSRPCFHQHQQSLFRRWLVISSAKGLCAAKITSQRTNILPGTWRSSRRRFFFPYVGRSMTPQSLNSGATTNTRTWLCSTRALEISRMSDSPAGFSTESAQSASSGLSYWISARNPLHASKR